MPRLGPLTPIFRPDLKYGSLHPGATVGVAMLTATIEQGATQTDPATGFGNVKPIVFDIAFSEAVSGFTSADVTLSGTATGLSKSILGTGPTYTLEVTGMAVNDKTVIAAIPAAGVTAVSSGLSNHAATSADNTVTYAPVIGTVTSASTLSNIHGLAKQGDILFGVHSTAAGSAQDGIVSLDVSDPTNPTVISSLLDDTKYNPSRGIAVDGSYAYVTSFTKNRMAVIDISNPASMTEVGSITNATTVDDPVGIVKSGNYCFLACRQRFTTIDVTTPATPTVAASITNATHLGGNTTFETLVKDGNYCYLGSASATAKFTIIDVTTPTAPTVAGSVTITGSPVTGIYIDGNTAFVCVGNRFYVIDITTKSAPTITATIFNSNVAGWSVTKSGNFCFIDVSASNNVARIDVTTLASPALSGTITDTTKLSTPRPMLLDSGLLYLSAIGNDRISIVKIT